MDGMDLVILEVFAKLNALRFCFLLRCVVETVFTLPFLSPKIYSSFVFSRRGCSDEAKAA